MLPSALCVQGRRELLSTHAVKLYRQHGVLVVRDYLRASQLRQLTAACRGAVATRGNRIFPVADVEQNGLIRFDAQMRPVPSVRFDKLPVPPELQQRVDAMDAAGTMERRVCTAHLRVRNAAAADRLLRRLRRARARHYRMNGITHVPSIAPDDADDAEASSSSSSSSSGHGGGAKVSKARLRKLASQYAYADAKRSYEHCRDTGAMELAIRRAQHVDDMVELIQNWTKVWSELWPECADLRALVCGDVGRKLGEAAAALTGEVVVRLFADAAHESCALMNGTPMLFAAAGACYTHPGAMTVLLGLDDATGARHAHASRVAVVPGSHQVLRSLTRDGAVELDRLTPTAVFDTGRNMRALPELAHLPAVVLPPLEPGMAVFLHHYTCACTVPTMTGAMASRYLPPTSRPSQNLHYYTLSLIPDRCVFNGRRDSWRVSDSHGPMHTYQRGQLLTDDAHFPVLHRALDIE